MEAHYHVQRPSNHYQTSSTGVQTLTEDAPAYPHPGDVLNLEKFVAEAVRGVIFEHTNMIRKSTSEKSWTPGPGFTELFFRDYY